MVVDDGSRDGTAELLASWRGGRPLRALSQPALGPAVARNRGVAAARGDRVAFLGDDTVPEPDWLAAHEAGRGRQGGGDEIAVVGYTGWHRAHAAHARSSTTSTTTACSSATR